jgi:type III secretory pathway component EscS
MKTRSLWLVALVLIITVVVSTTLKLTVGLLVSLAHLTTRTKK